MSKEPTSSVFSRGHVDTVDHKAEAQKKALATKSALNCALNALAAPAPNDAITEQNRVASTEIARLIDELEVPK